MARSRRVGCFRSGDSILKSKRVFFIREREREREREKERERERESEGEREPRESTTILKPRPAELLHSLNT